VRPPKGRTPPTPKRRRRSREPQYASPTYKRLLAQLAEGVRSLRSQHGWTQEAAAHEAEIPLRLFQALEAGESNATMTSLARLCRGFKVEIRDLFAVDVKH